MSLESHICWPMLLGFTINVEVTVAERWSARYLRREPSVGLDLNCSNGVKRCLDAAIRALN